AARLAEEERLGMVELDHAGGRAVDAHLPLDAGHAHAIPGAVWQRHGAERQAESVGRAARLVESRTVARQHEVHVGAAVRDEDLAAVDEVAAVFLAEPREDAAEIRSRLR